MRAAEGRGIPERCQDAPRAGAHLALVEHVERRAELARELHRVEAADRDVAGGVEGGGQGQDGLQGRIDCFVCCRHEQDYKDATVRCIRATYVTTPPNGP